jgi:uncharacterized protein YecE (DUF72 family)
MNYLGCSGWFYWHWKGKFYPNELPQSKWFQYYAQHFNTVELNSTFYHFPKQSTAKNWYRQAPKGFVYTLKVNKNITHIKKFVDTQIEIKNFYKLGDELKEKMGCFLFQLPPSLKFDGNLLKKIIEQLDPERKNVIEFRDKSWFKHEVYEELDKANITFCIVSSPTLPEDFVKTSKDIYIRFHGKTAWYRYDYSQEELKAWSERIKKAKPENAWVYFNNDANAFSADNCLKLKRFLE